MTALAAASCATTQAAPRPTIFDNLAALCGRAFEGRITSPPAAADASFAS
jgi:hypothetical protein